MSALTPLQPAKNLWCEPNGRPDRGQGGLARGWQGRGGGAGRSPRPVKAIDTTFGGALGEAGG